MQAGTVKDHVLAGVRAAIIDLDGTMLDTVPDFHVAINGMRAELGLAPITPSHQADGGQGLGKPDPRVLALDFDAAGVEQRFEQAMDAYQRHYLAINGQFSTLYPDVEAGLAAMQAAGLRLACVTNKPIAFARRC
jgi:phosphoglycolate phosphatase